MMSRGDLMIRWRRFFRRLRCRFRSRARFQAEYDAAMRRDYEYARQHPGCGYAAAHRERDRVLDDYE